MKKDRAILTLVCSKSGYLFFIEEIYNVRASYLSVTFIMFEVEVDAAEEWAGLLLKVKFSYIFQIDFSTKINVDI